MPVRLEKSQLWVWPVSPPLNLTSEVLLLLRNSKWSSMVAIGCFPRIRNISDLRKWVAGRHRVTKPRNSPRPGLKFGDCAHPKLSRIGPESGLSSGRIRLYSDYLIL